MLKKEMIEGMAQRLGITLPAEAWTPDTEVEVQLPEGEFWKKEDFDARVSREKKTAYDDGKEAGEEMAVKELKRDKGLEFEGKTVKAYTDALIKKLESENKSQPDERLKEKDRIIAELQKNLEASETEKTSFVQKAKQAEVDAELLDSIPGALLEGWTKREVLSLFKSMHEIDEEDGVRVIKKAGNVMRDQKTQQPVKTADIIKEFLESKKLVATQPQPTPGRGGKNEPGEPGGLTSLNQIRDKATYNKYLADNKIEPGGKDDLNLLTTLAKESPEVLAAINRY